MEEQDTQPIRRRRRRLRRWHLPVGGLVVLLIGALVIVWFLRIQLATDYIDREFARRDVQATYDVKRIGFGTQIFENLVIGDPRRPDLTARVVRIQILVGLTGPRVGLITARGVRMYGRVVDGRVTFGQVDRLLPPPSGLPFRLPEQRVDIADAAIVLDSPAGRVAMALAGQGNLADGFRGQAAMVSRGLRFGECVIARPTADMAVSVTDLRPRFRGPLATQSVHCGDDLAVERPVFAADAIFAPAIDSWRGVTAIRAARFAAGPQYLAGIEGRLTFDGNAQRTAGSIAVGAAVAAVDAFRAGRSRFAGRYAISPRHGDLGLSGDLAIRGLTVEAGILGEIASTLRSADGTPFGPIGAALAQAVIRAGRGGSDATAELSLINRRSVGAARFERLRLAARSGASLLGDRVTYHWPSGLMQADGQFALSGGGFPDARFTLRQARAGAPLEGVGRVEAMRVGSARLALDEIRFTAGPDGRTNFQTSILVDGPLSGGRINGLMVPLRGRFGRDGFAIGESCVTASFRALQIEGLILGPSRVPLCPVGRAMVWKAPGGPLHTGAELRAPRFAGRLGQSPIQLIANRIRVDEDGFTGTDLVVRLGGGEAVNRLEVASLSGRFVTRGVSGTFTGLSGQLANVPLVMSEGSGRWQVVRGNVSLEGRMQVADERDPPRFFPLVSDDFRLTLVDNRIHATGWLKHPQSGTRVAYATIDHNLRAGAGQALIDVPGLTFTEDFRPDALTPLTTGVVALVEGTVTGEGRIEWDSAGTRSTGTFSTAGMNLAFPFGPVEGLTTTVRFTDLLGLVSAPGQVAELGLVRAGVDIYDGRVVYQLQPNYHVAIESGRWPYAGGELILQPTVLDFSQPSTKYLTFRVIGLDAARFVQLMEFSNISATGTFDGIVPMRFDQRGGSIVGGRLAARPPGGTLSYIGELTDRDLGVYGKLAFDALKSLRYSRFDLTLDGSLEGEFVSNINLDGIARDPALTTVSGGGIAGIVARRALSQLAKIPFEFNIRLQGPFRALLATARSFEDPSALIQSVLPDLLRNQPTEVQGVQQEESENRR